MPYWRGADSFQYVNAAHLPIFTPQPVPHFDFFGYLISAFFFLYTHQQKGLPLHDQSQSRLADIDAKQDRKIRVSYRLEQSHAVNADLLVVAKSRDPLYGSEEASEIYEQ